MEKPLSILPITGSHMGMGGTNSIGALQVADQVLADGWGLEECSNMMQFAATIAGCENNQLSLDEFAKLVSHLYN